MTTTAVRWFLIYFFEDGKNRRFFCKGSGEWRNAKTCGSYTFQKLGETKDSDLVSCTQGHQSEVLKGYSTERRQVEGGLF